MAKAYLRNICNLGGNKDDKMKLFNILAGLAAGAAGSMGLGGGGVLMLYLTLILGLEQNSARNINLLFFIPCAVVSLFFHYKNKLIDIKPLLPVILGGFLGVAAGVLISGFLPSGLMRKAFAVFLFYTGVREITAFIKSRKK